MSIKLEDFKSALKDICRPNRFRVSIDYPSMISAGVSDEANFFIKGISIPDKILGEIELCWQGYKYKVAGDPSFTDVTMTCYNHITSGGRSLRSMFEYWIYCIALDKGNEKLAHREYKGTFTIEQLDGLGNVVSTYSLELAHPKEISSIELSMDNTDQVEEFTVTISYSYFKSSSGFF